MTPKEKTDLIKKVVVHFRDQVVDALREQMHAEIDALFQPPSLDNILENLDSYLQDRLIEMYEEVECDMVAYYEEKLKKALAEKESQEVHKAVKSIQNKPYNEFVDLSQVKNPPHRYAEYDRLQREAKNYENFVRAEMYKNEPIKVDTPEKLYDYFGQPLANTERDLDMAHFRNILLEPLKMPEINGEIPEL